MASANPPAKSKTMLSKERKVNVDVVIGNVYGTNLPAIKVLRVRPLRL